MTKLKKWTGIFLCGASWTWMYGFFLRLEANVEPQMFARGQGSRWWGIVLLYWIVDTAVLLSLARFVARPFGFRMPPASRSSSLPLMEQYSCCSYMSPGCAPITIFIQASILLDWHRCPRCLFISRLPGASSH